jgi:hypothetical protein
LAGAPDWEDSAYQRLPEISRLHSQAVVEAGPPVADDHVYRVVDAIDEVAKETGKTVPQNRHQPAAAAADRRDGNNRRAQ